MNAYPDHVSRGSIDWPAAIWAGVIAGAIFMVLELIMVPLFLGASAWGPPRMIAAIIMGQEVLLQPATFEFGIVLVALVVHFALSIVYAILLALLVHNTTSGVAILIGLFFGLVLYLVNFYGFTALFPWFAMGRNWVSIFTHLAFGGSAAWAYKRLMSRRTFREPV